MRRRRPQIAADGRRPNQRASRRQWRGGGASGAILDVAGSMLPQVRDVLPPQPQVVPGMYGGAQVTVDQSTHVNASGMSPKNVASQMNAAHNDRVRTNMTGLPKSG